MTEQTPQHDTSSSKNEPFPSYQKIIIMPIQANLREDDNLLTKMDPYCIITIGRRKKKTEVAKNTGKHPFWNSVIALKLKEKDYLCVVKIRNRKHGLFGKTIAKSKILLNDLKAEQGTKWFELLDQGKKMGRILLDISFV